MKFCRHKREIAATTADGRPGLQCTFCFRIRPHPWNQTAEQRRRWSRKAKKSSKQSVVYAGDILGTRV